MTAQNRAIVGHDAPASNRGGAMSILVSVVILAGAILTRTGLMSAPPEFDELYHYLAALGWLDTGELRILDGSYTRASVYTLAVARFLDVTGQDSLAAARIVSLVPGLALPLALFWWMRGRVGILAAAIAAGFAVLWPQGIVESQLLRFYSLHVLLFFAGAAAVYAAATTRGAGRWVWATTAVAFLAIAARLQITTVIGCAGLAVWLVARAFLGIPSRRRAIWGIAAVALTLLALGLLWPTGVLEKSWALYRFAPGNAVANRDYVAFYHNGLRNTYETFWPLFPLAVLIALRINATLTTFCVAIFGTVFVAQSFGAMKADRYVSGAMLFFFAVWGLAGAGLMQMARRWLPGSKMLRAAFLVAVVGFVMVSNGFVISSAKLTAGGGYDPRYRPDFTALPTLLDPWADAPFVATTNELHVVAMLGDYDVDLRQRAGWEAEFDAQSLFGSDLRTGRYAVRGQAGMERLLACVRSGVLITVDDIWFGDRIGGAFRKAIAAQGLELEMRREAALVGVRWVEGDGRAQHCDGLPTF